MINPSQSTTRRPFIHHFSRGLFQALASSILIPNHNLQEIEK